MTSTGVVNYVKKTLNCKKAGHTGTLDPLAAGVLPICVGRGTKVASYILDQDKTYICEATLGKQTDTDDLEGKIISSVDNVSVTRQDIEEVLMGFRGDIMQVPPVYSAIRHGGKRLYELARKGEIVNPKPRAVTIHNIDLIQFYYPDRFLFKAKCSKGTYMRSLCRDIGQALGCGAHMSFLLRTQTGSFHIKDSITLDELKYYHRNDKIDEVIDTVDSALIGLGYVIVDGSQYERLINGGFIDMKYIDHISPLNDSEAMDKYMKVYCNGQLIGTGFFEIRTHRKILRLKRLLI